MLPLAMNSAAVMRPGTLRPLPARKVRAHAGLASETASDMIAEMAKSTVEPTASGEVPPADALAASAPQPPPSPVPIASAETLPDMSAPVAPKTAQLPEIPVPQGPSQETLAMQDILPDVKVPEVEPSVADKVESMFSKASSVFQKMQPEPRPEVVAEPSPSSANGVNVAEMLESIKDATADMAKPPAPSPPAPVPATPVPSSASVSETVAAKVQPLQEAVQDAVTEPAASTSGASAPASATDAGNTVASALEGTNQQAGPGVLARAMEYTDGVVDRAEGVVGNFIDNATGQATSMMQNMGEGVYNSMPKSLPPNLQSKADVIGGNFEAAKAVYDDAPGVYLLLGALAIGSSAYAFWKFEYGGYKGVYSPVDMLEALNREDNVYVVDIRTDEDLKEQGVLDLKRGARGKATHLPLVDVPDAVKGDVDNNQKLQLQLNAALVTSLNEVNRFTKIVVMDSRGSSVKGLARAITEQGYRGYMLSGGFRAWKAGGLATKFGSYAVTPADLLADKGEELSEAAEQTAEKLRQPRNAALALLTFASAVAVCLYPHESFRLIGVLGIELTILVKLLSYESPSAAVDDVSKGFRSIKDKFSSAKAQAADFAEVAQARTVTDPQPTAADSAAEAPQKSSPVSEVRESAAAEAVKEAQAALERMVAQSKEDKPPAVPAPQASTSPTTKKEDSKAAKSMNSKPAASQAEQKPAATAPSGKAADSKASDQSSKSIKWPAKSKSDEVAPPKPVVDSLPYMSAEDKANKRQTGPDGAKAANSATKGK